MAGKSTMALDPAAMSAFAATLSTLPQAEIVKAKRLYVLNAVADYESAVKSGRAMVIVMGVMSIIPVFLIVFIPAFIAYRSEVKAGKQKILNALEVWDEELADDAPAIREQLDA